MLFFRSPTPRAVFTCLLCIACAGCSVRRLALRKAADALSGGGGSTFASDNDPELVADALPFALKTYESLAEAVPEDDKLLEATGKSYCMYAYAFVLMPADTLPDSRIDERIMQYQRAKNLLLRARGYLLRSLDLRHPGFERLILGGAVDSALALVSPADTTALYWTASSWMAAFTADKFDMALAVSSTSAVAIMRWLLDVNSTFNNGAVHDFFVSYYGSMPASMGGSEEKAREHFERAVEISNGRNPSPYIALAASVAVKNQNHAEFRSLLTKATAIEPEPENRLAALISQRKAAWLLRNDQQFFLLDETNTEEDAP